MTATYDIKKVVVTVSGGVAQVAECPEDVRVEIRDFDNQAAEEVEDPDCRTTELFWDCECSHDYIHPRVEDECLRCGAIRVEQPDARIAEVLRLIELSAELRVRLMAEAEHDARILPGSMIAPPRSLLGATFLEAGLYADGRFQLEGQGDLLLDEKGRVWVLTPWTAEQLPAAEGS